MQKSKFRVSELGYIVTSVITAIIFSGAPLISASRSVRKYSTSTPDPLHFTHVYIVDALAVVDGEESEEPHRDAFPAPASSAGTCVARAGSARAGLGIATTLPVFFQQRIEQGF